MSEDTKSARAEGMFEELGGTIKKNLGHLIGNEQMELEGKVKQLKGKARQESAMAAERAEGAVQEAVGTVENRIGHLVDSETMQTEGKLKQVKGRAKQKANK